MSFDFYRLGNGVRVVLVPMKGVKSLGIGVYIETGSRYETKENNGISHFLEHMVFKGTKNYPTTLDTSSLEGLGAIQNAWTNVDATAYWTKIPSNFWKEGLSLVKDLALYPTLPDKDLEIERGVIVEEIRRRNDRPDELASELMQKVMFGDSPLGMSVLGPEENIKKMSRDEFVNYHKGQYVAGRLVVVLAGDMEGIGDEVKKSIEDYFGGLSPMSGNSFEPIQYKDPGVGVLNKELANQAHLFLTFKGVSSKDKRRYPLSILSSYLGEGLSSRLFMELREKRGLCYAVGVDESRFDDGGIWGVYAGVALDKLESALEGIWGELKLTAEKPMSQADLDKIKLKIRGSLLFSQENPISQMSHYARQALTKPDDIKTHDQFMEGLMAVTIEDIQSVSKDIILSTKPYLSVAGPVNEDRVSKIWSKLV